VRKFVARRKTTYGAPVEIAALTADQATELNDLG
jgi:hypothetical protein